MNIDYKNDPWYKFGRKECKEGKREYFSELELGVQRPTMYHDGYRDMQIEKQRKAKDEHSRSEKTVND